MNSEYLRFKEFEKSKNLICPVQFVVGQKTEKTRKNDILKLETKEVTAIYITLGSVFKKLFEIANLLPQVLNYMNQLKTNKCVSNIAQSPHFTAILNKFNKRGNPLGSHSGIHKLEAVYVSVACFPPEFRALLENIFLALLFHAEDRKEFGNLSLC
ncbi:hypothetical protein FQR65_LT14573 [Abscondita terminalis]|nr:hypothetical protein FQR65_LT14573 [Abscondita terminalis]